MRTFALISRTALCAGLVLFFGAAVSAQEKLSPVSGEEYNKVLSSVNKAASSIKTLSAGFTQKKDMSLLSETMTSKGRMYLSHGKLRWEYTSPYTYLLVINSEKVLLQSSSGRTTLDVAASRMYRNIASIVMDSVTGEGIGSGKDFDAVLYRNSPGEVVADLTPRARELKSVFSSVRLHFGKDYRVRKIELFEKSGDRTEVILSDVKYNADVDPSLFEIK